MTAALVERAIRRYHSRDRNPYVGAQAVGEGVFGRLLAAIDNFTVAPDRFVDGGDDVVVFGRYSGTMKDSGAKLDAPFCHAWRFKADKIVSFQQYTDSAQWARLMPSPPRQLPTAVR